MEMDSVEEMLGKSVENKEISPKGRKCSEETKAKISAAKRGRKLSDEHRAKISAAGRGRKLSEETKAKISAAWTPERRAEASQIPAMRLGTGRFGTGGGFFREGYWILTGQRHPLAREGAVAEHRKVLYDAIGPGPHECHWDCGRSLGWGGRNGIHADHVDGDKTNNSVENLVVSCGPCNALRAYDGNPREWSPNGL
jgi:hypothetical protein